MWKHTRWLCGWSDSSIKKKKKPRTGKHQKLVEAQKDSPSACHREHGTEDTWVSAPRTARHYMSVVSGHLIFGTSVQQPKEMTTELLAHGFCNGLPALKWKTPIINKSVSVSRIWRRNRWIVKSLLSSPHDKISFQVYLKKIWSRVVMMIPLWNSIHSYNKCPIKIQDWFNRTILSQYIFKWFLVHKVCWWLKKIILKNLSHHNRHRA